MPANGGKNSIKQIITNFHYGKFSIILALLLFIPSLFYLIAISIKNFLYKINLLKEKHVWAKVICVGNLTTGGVGKTPVVIEIANYLADKGKRVAVLSRGYGGKLKKGEVHLIKKYNEILIDNPELSGDEVCLIAKKTHGVAVIASTNRFLGAKYASEELNADVIVTDDGFSNRSLYKDLTILLFDTEKLTGNGFCLPMGPLREPVSQIGRAQKILFIDKNNTQNKNFEKFKNKIKIPTAYCKMAGAEIYNIKTGEILTDAKEIIAFSGIGQPEQFYEKLNNFKILKTFNFDDHFEYKQKTLEDILSAAISLKAKAVITTEKDAVKLLRLDGAQKIYALRLKPELNPDELVGHI